MILMLDSPGTIRLTYFFNVVFLSLLVRSGIEILGGPSRTRAAAFIYCGIYPMKNRLH